MYSSRRIFLRTSFTIAAAAVLGTARQQQQQRPGQPFPSQRPTPTRQPEPPELPPAPKPNRAVLKANRETIAKDVARMSDLLQELQKSLDAHDTTEVLSIDILRKSEEIEKLARQVRDLVRG